MIIPDPHQTFEFVPESEKDKPESERAVFIVSAITGRQRAKIRDQSYKVSNLTPAVANGADAGDIGLQILSGRLIFETLDAGLRDWRNLRFPDGREIPYSKKNTELVPYAVADEIATYIHSLSQPTLEQAKN